ncbi:mycofactocin biosynthesis glycosyltransferase MftF [soil metagenome]
MTLPLGFAVALTRNARVLDGGRALLGGAPTRVVYLTKLAQTFLARRSIEVTDAASAVLADRLLELGMADPILDRLPENPEDYTVVVPVRDRAEELARLLASVEPGRPVIVVDDASRHPERVAAVAARAGAQLIALDENIGPGGARNAGMARVTTPFVVFVDSDIVLDADTVSVLLKHFADPKVAMAVPRIVGLETPGSGSWVGRYEDARSSLDLGRHPAGVRPRSPVSWASTACVVARVDALGEGFDARMRVGEDVDLGWRLVDAGWRIRYEPAVRARHEHRVRFGDWFLRKAVYGTGAQPLAERHPRDIAPAVLAPWSVGVLLALLAQRRWSVPVAGAISLITATRIARKLERVKHPLAWGAWLTANGIVGAVGQASALLLRHWWPIALVLCLFSSRMRRAVAVAAITDVALEYRRNDAGLDPIRFGLARRLDDLAYGAGVWFGAIRARSIAALLPDVRGS